MYRTCGPDRRPGDRGAEPAAAVLAVDVHLGDLGRGPVVLELREAHGHTVPAHREHLRPAAQCDLAGLGVITAGVEVGEVLAVPGDPQVVHGVVADLLDGDIRPGRRRGL